MPRDTATPVANAEVHRDSRKVKAMNDSDPKIKYRPIGDDGLISDMNSCALVSRDGSIDWCCFPRFDSASVFGRILDWGKGGYFQLTLEGVSSVTRRYLSGTNVLETTFEADSGRGKLTDFMTVHPSTMPDGSFEIGSDHRVVRILECVSGSVNFVLDCFPRFDYGAIVPHATLTDPHNGFAHGGADALSIYCSAPLRESGHGFVSGGLLRHGEKVQAVVTYSLSMSHTVEALDESLIAPSLDEAIRFWREWSATCRYEGAYRDEVVRSALTLKALTYSPSGAMVAAATTSLPEVIGGPRNSDYRYTWIRDASFAQYALSILGYMEEAEAFKAWLEWSTVGRAKDLQVVYGLSGERRLMEVDIPELEGYRGSRPVRMGNAAHSQFQLDMYGEVLDSAHLFRKFGGEMEPEYWEYLRQAVDFVSDNWREPDSGVWETGERHQFVFSKVWGWVALDRAIKTARALGLPGDVERWRTVRAEIKDDILTKGYDSERRAFVQSYGSKELDASSLMLPLVGFIKADDPRMRSTIEGIEREWTSPQGFVYRSRPWNDGFGKEGTFTICTFWLIDNLIALGEIDRATALFDKVLDHANDLGLLSEEIDGDTGELLGNFPQAFSHMGLINLGFPILAVFRLKRQPKRDDGMVFGSCKASQSPVYPIRDAILAVSHASCPSLSSSGPPPMG